MAEEKSKAAASSNSDSKLFAALGYIITVLVPLFVLFTEKKNDKLMAFHAWQSLILSVVCFVVFMAATVVILVLTIVSGGLAGILNCLLLPLMLVFLAADLYAAYKAYQGEMYKLPVIGDFSMKQAMK
ncbi:MAG: DUF4870 domain-containing protein [Candidatus ainarchaeum sp.]|nr:DUF4870 domain-containing protein [Candidatus ainarchaeum sp.]